MKTPPTPEDVGKLYLESESARTRWLAARDQMREACPHRLDDLELREMNNLPRPHAVVICKRCQSTLHIQAKRR